MKPSWGRLEVSWTRVGGYLDPSTAILGHLGGHLALSEALLEPSGAILDAANRRGPPPRPRGGGRGRGQDSLPARKPSRSLPPAPQHICSTRASACSAAVFGWAATGNQNRPHVRDAGARCATRARRARCARHPWGPSVPGTSGAPDALRAPRAPTVPHAPAAPGAPRSGHAQSVPGAPAHVTAHIGEHVGPPPSLSNTRAQSRRGAHHGVWWACTQQAICQHPRRPCRKTLESDRGVATHDPDFAAKCMLHCF